MNIGLVRRGYSPTGGAEAYLKRFAAGAIAAGHQCTLITSNEWPAGQWPHELVRMRRGTTPLEFALEVSESARARACDVLFSLERVLACDAYRAGDGVHAAWLERRGATEGLLRRWWRARRDKHHELLRLEETLFRGEGARAVVANSNMVRDEIVRHYGYPAERIHVIYNGVPPAPAPNLSAHLRKEVRQELGIDEGRYIMLFAGSGWERKGLRQAIEAVNQTNLGAPLLLVAGSGKRRGLPSSTRVRFLGPVPGLVRLMAASDIFVLPTLYDPFSNACLEALAAGLPVLTTAANGFAEIIEGGVEGEVLPAPADPVALARAMEQWAVPERRAAIRERLRAKGASYGMPENVRRTLVLLGEVRGGR